MKSMDGNRINKHVLLWAKAAADNAVKNWAYRVKQKFDSLNLVHFYNVDNVYTKLHVVMSIHTKCMNAFTE